MLHDSSLTVSSHLSVLFVVRRTFQWTRLHFVFQRVCETDACVLIALRSWWRFKGESEMSQTGLSFSISTVSQWGLSEVTISTLHWNILFQVQFSLCLSVCGLGCLSSVSRHLCDNSSWMQRHSVLFFIMSEWSLVCTDNEPVDRSGHYVCLWVKKLSMLGSLKEKTS